MLIIKLDKLRHTIIFVSTRYWAWIISGLLLLLLMLWDGITRINISSQAAASQYQVGKRDTVDQHLPALMASKINQLYAGYDLPVEVITENVQAVSAGMSDKEQLLQQGQLTKLFVGEHQYRLSGIFSDNDFYAILIKTSVNNRDTEEIKVTMNQKVAQYTVKTITTERVELVDGERQILLFMFDS